jgi:hypothetical protein
MPRGKCRLHRQLRRRRPRNAGGSSRDGLSTAMDSVAIRRDHDLAAGRVQLQEDTIATPAQDPKNNGQHLRVSDA